MASFSDQKSGATLDRPGLQRALDAAERGEFDVVLIVKVDRLVRSLRALVDVVDRLEQAAGVGFRSVTENFDTTTPLGKMTLGILTVFRQPSNAT